MSYDDDEVSATRDDIVKMILFGHEIGVGLPDEEDKTLFWNFTPSEFGRKWLPKDIIDAIDRWYITVGFITHRAWSVCVNVNDGTISAIIDYEMDFGDDALHEEIVVAMQQVDWRGLLK